MSRPLFEIEQTGPHEFTGYDRYDDREYYMVMRRDPASQTITVEAFGEMRETHSEGLLRRVKCPIVL